MPALVDNLALVYNKKLFAKAGLSVPTASWTWSDFENAAVKLTEPAGKRFGWSYVSDGSEDTVWRYWALLWQAGGAILNPAGTQAGFDSPAGLKALELLKRLAAKHATYLDNGSGNYKSLFGSGHIGMLWTGPADLPEIISEKVSYGVQILPGEANHQTISGPDNWVMFDNGAAHKQASWEFLKWLTSPQIDLEWSTMTGDLPIRKSVTKLPGLLEVPGQVPGHRDMGRKPRQRHPGAAVDRLLSEDLDDHRPDGAVGAPGPGRPAARVEQRRPAGQRDPGSARRVAGLGA